MRKSKNRIQHATLYTRTHCMAKDPTRPRAAFLHAWTLAIVGIYASLPFLIPNPTGDKAFRAKGQRQTSYNKVVFRMKPIFAFSSDRRAWNILPFFKTPRILVGPLCPAHPLPAYTFFDLSTLKRVTYRILTSFIFRCQRYSTNSKL